MSMSQGKQITSTVYTNQNGPVATSSTVGCFSVPTPLVNHGPYKWQSSGNCRGICAALNQPVFALSGVNCSCAEEFPPKAAEVNIKLCAHTCQGYNESCGGAGNWLVFLTGFEEREVDFSGAKVKGSTSETVVTIGDNTITKTVPGSSQTAGMDKSSGKGSGGGSTVGIAVGVVVGIVVLGAIIAGVFLFLKRQRRIAAEKDYQHAQDVQQFVVAGKSGYGGRPNMNDTRLDPEFMMGRRQSDGSIMDNQDYSRRILQVTNPDGR